MQLLGKGMSAEFWREVREKDCYAGYREALLSDFEELLSLGDLRALRYSDFKLFFVTGNRSVYEKEYTVHRKAMTVSAFLSLVYPEEEKYINYLMDAIYTVCDEYTWCLPAHQPSFEENNNCHIDLCGASMGFYLAIISTLLGDRLEPLIRSRINAEVERRVFEPFLKNEPYSWWETGTSNWTAVCMGSVACAFMLMRPEKARELIPRFEKSMAGFIRGFSSEGVCYEGGGYWNYGIGTFLPYADMIRTFTEGEIDYFKDPKIKKILTFYDNIFIGDGVVANFADCGEHGGRVNGRMHYIAKEYPDVMKSSGCKKSAFTHDYDVPIRFYEALWFYEEEDSGNSVNEEREFYAPEAEWYIRRNTNYGFAAKGGHNAEHHNHNDVGNFIFAVGNKQIISDLGSGVYTKQYFSPERYSILETSARSHNVPIIDGNLQKNGRNFAAKDFKYECGRVSVEIAGAYECLSENDSIKRNFDFTDRAVKLTDRFSFDVQRSVTERICSKIKPNIDTRGVVYIENVAIKYDADVWSVSISVENASKNNAEYYMMDFVPCKKVSIFELEIVAE
ncbi:MAG: heparinase II/III family protein [Clostridia bacterium]|nr:heparinase II/III family protein [Clostridia bacterium]